jgi:two-component system alkaline phosphatase synthesis response regulator PhoP
MEKEILMVRKILLVDDESDILQVISFRLEKAGYEVVLASNGEEALWMVEKESPDIVLLDVMMPGIDGFEVCKKIKQNDSNRKIIIYTDKVDGVNAEKARESGADDFTVKTAALKYILEAINQLIEGIES